MRIPHSTYTEINKPTETKHSRPDAKETWFIRPGNLLLCAPVLLVRCTLLGSSQGRVRVLAEAKGYHRDMRRAGAERRRELNHLEQVQSERMASRGISLKKRRRLIQTDLNQTFPGKINV